jgi:hypothetical protein
VNFFKATSFILSAVMLEGCATTTDVDGARGPELVSSGYATESGHYAEIGVQFTNTGDFLALFTPNRWKNPVQTGGSLSWLNPVAWSDDAGRTGRILVGDALLVGGVAVAAIAAGDSGSSGGETTSGGVTSSPPPPSGEPPAGPGGGGSGGPGGGPTPPGPTGF